MPVVLAVLGGLGGLGGVAGIISAVVSVREKRAGAEATESGTWQGEAKLAFDKVEKQCENCQAELKATKRQFARELSEVKDVLSKSLDAVDELLHPDGQSEDRKREIRVLARVARQALWQSSISL
jgi:hypothetical protein